MSDCAVLHRFGVKRRTSVNQYIAEKGVDEIDQPPCQVSDNICLVSQQEDVVGSNIIHGISVALK